MQITTIYELIALVEQRPTMFVRDKSLSELETYLYGYVTCLGAHDIEEPYSGRRFHPRDFAMWLYEARGWSGSCGFARAITENTKSRDEAFERFFELVALYRNHVTDEDREPNAG